MEEEAEAAAEEAVALEVEVPEQLEVPLLRAVAAGSSAKNQKAAAEIASWMQEAAESRESRQR